LPGSPDIVLSKYKIAIFVHGCFWHRHSGCSLAYIPKSNTEIWMKKFEINVERDKKAFVGLTDAGWKVIVVWECSLRKNSSASLNALSNAILSDRTL
jgi:DNA mismatch endonuclease (patch repair protein)